MKRSSSHKVLINILGAGRSGTTMLDLMLGSDSRSFSMGEVYALFRPYREHHFRGECNCGDINCSYWMPFKDVSFKFFLIKAFKEWQVDYLIDSSKNLPWVLDTYKVASNNNISVINFLVYKPIKSYFFSIWKRGESFDDAFYRYKNYYGRFFESGLDAYAINYKDLVSNPDNILERLVDITGQPQLNNRSKFWIKPHHYMFGSAGILKQVVAKKSSILKENEFPQKFELEFSRYEEKILNDSSFLKINSNLKKIDVRLRDGKLKHKSKIIYPAWYYYMKIKNRFHSYKIIRSKQGKF